VSSRTTGVQVATAALAAQVKALRELMAPREYVVVLDLHRRWLERELRRNERALRRWTM
jgi:hypothetical protein